MDNYLNDIFKDTNENYKKTNDRLVTFLITFSGAGIYLILELMKYLKEENLLIPDLLKYLGIAFVTCILSNFLSQFFMFNLFTNVLKIEQYMRFEEKDEIKINSAHSRMKIYQNFADFTMWISMLNMFIGVIGMVIFFWCYI